MAPFSGEEIERIGADPDSIAKAVLTMHRERV